MTEDHHYVGEFNNIVHLLMQVKEEMSLAGQAEIQQLRNSYQVNLPFTLVSLVRVLQRTMNHLILSFKSPVASGLGTC